MYEVESLRGKLMGIIGITGFTKCVGDSDIQPIGVKYGSQRSRFGEKWNTKRSSSDNDSVNVKSPKKSGKSCF